MKKYGYNSGYIGVDKRTVAAGTINYQKRMMEREANRMRLAGADIHRDGLVLSLLADNLPANTDSDWTDDSGNDYNYTFAGGPTITANSYMNFVNLDSTDDYLAAPTGMNPISSNPGTAVFVMSSTDTQGVFLTQNGGGVYLGAYKSSNYFYNGGFGNSIEHYHNKVLKDNIYVNFPDESWNMTEFKNINRNSDQGWNVSNYPGFEIIGKIRAFLLYNKVLTATESEINYDFFANEGYFSE